MQIQIKGFFSDRSVLFQLVILLYFVLIGILLCSAFGYAIIHIFKALSGIELTSQYDMPFYLTHITQFLFGILTFILPAICTAYFCSKKPSEFLNIKRSIDVRVLLLSTVMILLLSPAIDIASYLNSKIYLPEFMAPVSDWMQKSEIHASKVTEKILSEKGFLPLVTNIFIIGVMAGLTEEFIFRGALMSIIRKKIHNPHTAIWIVAIIFSIIHFQFSGFIPRTLLGAFLGYLLLWTNNLWIPVFVHFINNTIAVTGYYIGLYEISPESSALIKTDTSENDLYILTIIAIAGLALFVLCAGKMKKICSPVEKNLDNKQA